MAQFTKTHGDYQPVVVLDQGVANTAGAGWSNGLNAVVSDVPVQPQGPKLDFFTVTASGALSPTQVNVIVETTQQLATVYIYQYVNDTNDSLAMAVYPTGAWQASSGDNDLEASINTALTDAGVANTTTVTSVATFGA